jgi:membrane carboxypeptidase/penicillin-binding protein
MLSSVISEGTAKSARGAIAKTAIAGKTGTSRDGWFVGYTPNLVVAVWVGFDDNRQLGLTGAEAALPAWIDFVKGAVTLRPELGGEAFARPAGVTFVDIDPETGMRASAYCPTRERVAILPSMAPGGECTAHQPLINYAADALPVSGDESLERDVEGQPLVPQRTLQLVVIQPQPSGKERGALPPPIVEYGRATRKDRDKRGAPILVNELAIKP